MNSLATRPFFIHDGLQKKRVFKRECVQAQIQCPGICTIARVRTFEVYYFKAWLERESSLWTGCWSVCWSKTKTVFGSIPEIIDGDQGVESPLSSKLRRIVQVVHSKQYNFVIHPVKTGSTVSWRSILFSLQFCDKHILETCINVKYKDSHSLEEDPHSLF